MRPERTRPTHGRETGRGGQCRLPRLKVRLATAETLVDIGQLDELRGIKRLGDG